MRLQPKLRKHLGRQTRLLTSAESSSDKVTRRFTQAFNRRVEYAVRRQQMMTLLPTDRKGISDALLELMVAAYVKRYRLASMQSKLGLNLGFSDDVNKYAKEFDLDLGNIGDSFEWFVQHRTNGALSGIENRINIMLGDVTSKQLPTGAAVREARRNLEDMGITTSKPAIIETLVRTHSQIAFGAAQYKAEQTGYAKDVIWGYTYATVGDDRVRDEHAEMEGVTRPADDPIWDDWWPPNGWNCRCQLLPITVYDDELQNSTEIPKDVSPDTGFDFNPGKMLDAS